jgi:glutaredoxin-related protein
MDNFDFFDINNKAKKDFMKSRTYIQILKRTKNYTVYAHPDILEALSHLDRNLNIKKATAFAIDLTKVLSTEHSKHELTDETALSEQYLKKSIKHYSTYKDIAQKFLNRTFRGNSIQGICSAYDFDVISDMKYTKLNKAHKAGQTS